MLPSRATKPRTWWQGPIVVNSDTILGTWGAFNHRGWWRHPIISNIDIWCGDIQVILWEFRKFGEVPHYFSNYVFTWLCEIDRMSLVDLSEYHSKSKDELWRILKGNGSKGDSQTSRLQGETIRTSKDEAHGTSDSQFPTYNKWVAGKLRLVRGGESWSDYIKGEYSLQWVKFEALLKFNPAYCQKVLPPKHSEYLLTKKHSLCCFPWNSISSVIVPPTLIKPIQILHAVS